MNNYLLESPDSLSIQKEINNLIEKSKFKDAIVSNYDLDEASLENALEDLDTYGFLSTQKIIIIKNIDSIKQEENQKLLEHLYRYLDNPNQDNLLIICARKLNNTLKMVKELKKKMTYIEATGNALSLLKGELKGYQVEPGVERLLLDYCKEDLTKLQNECDKLKNFKYEEKIITKEDVTSLCIEKLENSSDLTFSFVRSLAEKDKKASLQKYQELLDHNIEPLNIVGLIASQIRIMYQVKILEKKHLQSSEIAKVLNEKPYRIQKTQELTRYYKPEELLDLMQKLQEIDMQIKTTDTDPTTLIELFIMNI